MTQIKAPKIGPMLRLVLGASRMLSPLAEPILKHRLNRGKEDPTRWREKLGEATAARPDGPLVWMHGVGVGEVMALRGLIDAMSARQPDLNFLITSSARSSADVVANNLPPRTQHQYLPLDFPAPVIAFLNHWKPDLAVWSDQEVWPRLAVTCAKRAIPQAYVAARITDDSAKARGKFGRAYGDLYGVMDVIHAQDDRTKSNLQHLMGPEDTVVVSGSIKATASPLACDLDTLTATISATQGRRIWCLASSHPGDEAIAIEAHETLLTSAPNALLIIAPRDPSTGDHIVHAMEEDGLNVARRGSGDLPPSDAPYFVADTFGELGLWYRVASAALIGGTFDAVEGHNPWEAVALGCPVLHGPRIANFATDFASLAAANAARPVQTPDDIYTALIDPDLPAMATRATGTLDVSAQGLPRIADDLIGLLPV
ncbi:3-deoxy-D-manno-octulosonic acid transferase [Octadecabacter sp.]|nr:3-deoxy-D-manno-octulosonic acid transferase [Octadecabacter sp.]